MSDRRVTWAVTALLAMSVALTAVIARSLVGASVDQGGTSVADPIAAPTQLARTSQPDGSRGAWADTALARPLFDRSRRPPAPAAMQAPEPERERPPELPRLSGVMVNGAERSAIFVVANGRPLVAREGSQVSGFTVQAIRMGQATLQGPSGTHVLRPTLRPQSAQSGTAPGSGLIAVNQSPAAAAPAPFVLDTPQGFAPASQSAR